MHASISPRLFPPSNWSKQWALFNSILTWNTQLRFGLGRYGHAFYLSFNFYFFFSLMLHTFVCQACSRMTQTQFSTSDSQVAIVFSSWSQSCFLCLLNEDKSILHSLDLICCVSNNFLALFSNDLQPHWPPLFSVQFPDSTDTAEDQNNTDKAWLQSTLTCF